MTDRNVWYGLGNKRNYSTNKKGKEEKSVTRPVVSQSKKILRMSYFIRIFFFMFMLLLLYLTSQFFGIDFNLILMKLKSILLGKSLHFLFSRLGWCVGGIIDFAVLCFDPETFGKMMASGSGSGEGRGFESLIEEWLNQEKASSNTRHPEEEAGTSASGATRPRPSSTLSPLPSIESRGLSWVSEAYGSTSSSAPHPTEEANDPHPAPPELHAPSEQELSHQLDSFTSSFNKIATKNTYLIILSERLRIGESTPQRRNKIVEGMEIISSLQGQDKPTSGRKAGDALVAFMRQWDEQQGWNKPYIS